MWHNTCQLGQPELYYGILPQIGAKNLTKPCRKRGRPAQRWDDHLTQFAVQHFGDEHWPLIAKRNSMQFLLKYE